MRRVTAGEGLWHRVAVWRAGFARPASGFHVQPEPRSIGLVARGQQLVAGKFACAGHLVQAPGRLIWDVAFPDRGFARDLHGFAWLDDLAALGDAQARGRAQDWTRAWIQRFGRGGGPGWAADLTGRRLIRWIHHAALLTQGRDGPDRAPYFRALTVQTVFLSRRWSRAAPGLPRFEALCGLIIAALALQGTERLVGPALSGLIRDCQREVDADGGLPSRNPEELLEVFTLLTWAALALAEANRTIPAALSHAIARIAPCLRALRHADGGLARCHGGDRGVEGRLEQALAQSGVRAGPPPGPAMGFVRLASGRSTVIVDAAPPPASALAHAATLAFELTSGRRPLIVNCGAGAEFGPDWHLAGRATASHSTLCLDGISSSRLGRDGVIFAERAAVPTAQQAADSGGMHLSALHTGWSASHGLAHGRVLTLDAQGRRLTGTDMLESRSPGERKRLAQILTARPEGVEFSLRFHLHPDVEATLDTAGAVVSLALKSGEVWLFRHDGRCALTLDPSVYLEKGRPQPRAARQIVLSGLANHFETRIGWTLAKAQDTPLAIRDLGREDAQVPV